MKIIITGCNGFVGTNLKNRLNKYDVFGINREKLDFNECDISKNILQLKKTIPNPDTIIHLTSLQPGSYSLEDYVKVNVLSIVQLIEYFKPSNFIFVSTTSLYDISSTRICHENSIRYPHDYYCLSKILAENTIIELTQLFKINSTIIRVPSIFGKGNKNGFVDNMISEISCSNTFDLWGSDDSIRDSIYIDELCNFINKQILLKPDIGCSIINLGRGHPYTLLEYASIISKYYNPKCCVNLVNKPIKSHLNQVADITKARELYSYQPLSLDEIISEYYAS